MTKECAMLIVVLAAAMCLAMLIATAFAIREETESAKVEIRRHAAYPFTARLIERRGMRR